jgi:hypothetical protein
MSPSTLRTMLSYTSSCRIVLHCRTLYRTAMICLLGWGIFVAIFGIVLFQQHQNFQPHNSAPSSGMRSFTSLSTRNVSVSSPFENRSTTTENVVKLSKQKQIKSRLGERKYKSQPASGIIRKDASPLKKDQSDGPQENTYLQSLKGLPNWAGRADHKVAVGDTDPEPFQVLDARCNSFDHSIKRPRHGCDANNHTRNVFCNFDQLRIDNGKIKMDQGGEVLSTVMGRGEDPEFPKYKPGAFALSTKPDNQVLTEWRYDLHYLEGVLNAMLYPSEENRGKIDLSCDETYPGITLFITRYEYVNLYHTLTDWWSAYFVLPEDYWQQPHRVVVLDGHAQGGLDDVWKVLFGDFHFIKHLPKGKGLCFEKAVFVPAGYKASLYPDLMRERCPNQTMASDFSQFVLGRYNLQSVQPIWGNIVIIDRQPYVSHPRSDTSTFRRKSSNFEKLQSTLEKIPHVTVQLVRLETLSFREQLKLIRQAHVLIGNHGAGLTHLMFMDQSHSHVLEISVHELEYFQYLSKWRGISLEIIQHFDSDFGDEQINKVSDLVQGFMAMRGK